MMMMLRATDELERFEFVRGIYINFVNRFDVFVRWCDAGVVAMTFVIRSFAFVYSPIFKPNDFYFVA